MLISGYCLDIGLSSARSATLRGMVCQHPNSGSRSAWVVLLNSNPEVGVVAYVTTVDAYIFCLEPRGMRLDLFPLWCDPRQFRTQRSWKPSGGTHQLDRCAFWAGPGNRHGGDAHHSDAAPRVDREAGSDFGL